MAGPWVELVGTMGWQCWHSWLLSFHVTFLLVFITFKVKPERTTVYPGHTALLRCEAQGDPTPLIQWKGKDRILDPTKLGPR